MFFNKQLRKVARKVFFMDLSFGGKFKPIAFPQYDLSIHKHFFRSLVLGHVGEYFQAIHVLAPFLLHSHILTPPQLLSLYIPN